MSGLVVRDLTIGRDGFSRGPIDFSAPTGTVVALIGPNGGGKTTLLKTLAGLIPPLSGTIESGAPGPVAYLPPPGAVAAAFSALHLAALGRAGTRGWSAGLAPNDFERAEQALDSLGVGDLAQRPFDRLSSGQQQLVLMARLLVQDARLCLLDEPTAMLDPANTAAVEAAIGALARSGRTAIVSTHGLGLAARSAQVLALGMRFAAGPPAAILDPPALSALFGVDIEPCPCCGQPRLAAPFSRASPSP